MSSPCDLYYDIKSQNVAFILVLQYSPGDDSNDALPPSPLRDNFIRFLLWPYALVKKKKISACARGPSGRHCMSAHRPSHIVDNSFGMDG